MSTNLPPEESLNWKRAETIDLPMPENEGRLAIRHQDWRRLRIRIQRMENRGSNLAVVYSIFLGVAGSAGLSILPISQTKDLPSWVTPLYVCVFVFSALCGLVFVMVERGLRKKARTAQTDIIEEMSDIEGTFVRKKGAPSGVDTLSNTLTTNPEGPRL